MLTASAGLLMVLAVVGLLSAGQHAHRADVGVGVRGFRLGVAAAAVCLGSLGTTALLGAEPGVSWTVAILLAGSVLARWRLTRTWSARGVVAWALFVTATVGLVAWLAQRVVTDSDSGGEIAVGAAAWAALVVAASRLWSYVRERVADRAVRHVGDHGDGAPARPVPWWAAVAATAATSVLLAPGGTGWDRHGPAPVAGHTRTDLSTRPTPSLEPSARATRGPTAAGSAHGATRPDGVSSRTGGVDVPTAPTGSAGPPASVAPRTDPSPRPASGKETKTPGWAKDKPNRPTDAPAPGPGRPRSP